MEGAYKHHFSTKNFGSGAYRGPHKSGPSVILVNFLASGAYKGGAYRGTLPVL